MMNGIERIGSILKRKPTDRIGVFEHFWKDTRRKWARDGFIKDGEDLNEHFGFDIELCWPFDLMADIRAKPEIIEENEETILVKDGNGAFLRRHKLHDTTPEHVDFSVKDRTGWEALIKPKLTADRERIDFEGYREARRKAAKAGRFFMWSGVNIFELMHPVCGHENLLIGMALDTAWIADMVKVYSRLIVELQEILFSEEGYPDGIWYYEDMGFKQRPFFSPDMYREMMQPGHKYTIDYAKSHKLPVVMHSCGMVEALVPGMIESGIDCLQVLEVKAGMDPVKLYREYGDILSFMGGIDVRVLYSNDREQVLRELESKVPELMGKHGFILHSDHSIPETVEYGTYRFFVETGLRLGTYRTVVNK